MQRHSVHPDLARSTGAWFVESLTNRMAPRTLKVPDLSIAQPITWSISLALLGQNCKLPPTDWQCAVVDGNGNTRAKNGNAYVVWVCKRIASLGSQQSSSWEV